MCFPLYVFQYFYRSNVKINLLQILDWLNVQRNISEWNIYILLNSIPLKKRSFFGNIFVIFASIEHLMSFNSIANYQNFDILLNFKKRILLELEAIFLPTTWLYFENVLPQPDWKKKKKKETFNSLNCKICSTLNRFMIW